MEDIIPFTIEELQEMVVSAVDDYFTTMLDSEATLIDARPGETDIDFDEPPPPVFQTEKPLIVGMIGFIGTISGVINLYLEEDLALLLTTKFLGMTEEEVEEEGFEVVNDCLGEMSNMIVGTLKNDICDRGHQCRMTVPSIVRGSNFSIQTPDTFFRYIYTFKSSGGSKFIADLTMKMEDDE